MKHPALDLEGGFAELFQGRTDAYGEEDGGCYRVDEDWSYGVGIWAQHLCGAWPIGVYPMVEDREKPDGSGITHTYGWRVRWGCVDLDVKTESKPSGDYETEEHAHQAARDLMLTLSVGFGITSWIEVTRSRGRHVWVFSEDWVPAQHMRRALVVACDLAGVSTREVNPKQETLAEGQLGNYVRLPYPGALAPGPVETRYILHPRTIEPTYFAIGEFIPHALAHRTHSSVLQASAKFWVPPAPAVSVEVGEVPDLDRTITSKLSGLAWKILNEGPLEGRDRSSTLMRLAHLLAEQGFPPEEAYAVLDAADAAWGKFHGRADCERQLMAMVERAYGHATPG